MFGVRLASCRAQFASYGRRVGAFSVAALFLALAACNQTNFSDSADPKDAETQKLLEAQKQLDQSPDLAQGPKKEKPDGACSLPWGGWINSGESIESYSEQQVVCGQKCSDRKTTLRCSSGTLSGPLSTHKFSACYEVGCASCSVSVPGKPNPITIPHQTSLDFYSTAQVACGQSCSSVKQTRTCDNGTLTGDTSFSSDTCTVAKCPCTHPTLGSTHPHGSILELFDTEQVQCGSCASRKTSRECVDGKWSGSDSFKHKSCTDLPCAPCTTGWGTSVAHNSAQEFFKEPSPACPTACDKVTRTCHNGTFSPTANGKDVRGFASQSCTCQCTIPGTSITLAPGQEIKRWTQANGSCGQTSDDFEVTIRCEGTSGVVARKKNGTSVAISGFNSWSTSQTVIETCKCTTVWGQAIPEGNSFYAYKNSQGACDSGCQLATNAKLYMCVKLGNVMKIVEASDSTKAFDPAFNKGGCTQPSCSCTTPWNQVVGHGAVIPAFKTAKTNCGTPCDGERMMIRCNGTSGTLSANDSTQTFDPALFKFGVCEVGACAGVGGGELGGIGAGKGRGSMDEDLELPGAGGGCGPGGCLNGCDFFRTYAEYLDFTTKHPEVDIKSSSLHIPVGLDKQCKIPWANVAPPGISPELSLGGDLTIGARVSAFTQSTVGCSQTCESVRSLIYCDHYGKLHAPPGPLYPSCTRSCP